MLRLVAAEFQKIATTRLWLWLLLASVAITALFASLAIAYAGVPGNPTPPLSSPGGQRTVLQVGSAAGALVAVLGAIGLTGEFRHATASATFLATPRRARVMLAKLVTHTLAGLGYALVCIAVTLAIAVPWLAARGITLPLTGHGIPATLAGVAAAVTLFAIVGVGLGALLGEQVATVVGLLVYLFVVEPVVTRIPALDSWSVYLPGSAANALTRVTQGGQRFLEPWQGGAVLAAYAIAFALAGAIRLRHRDVA